MTYEESIKQMELRFSSPHKPLRRETARTLAGEHDNSNMRYPELLALADALLTFSWNSSEYVCEIGTFHGITASFLGRLAAAAELPCCVVSVDSFESPYLAHLTEPCLEYYRTIAAYGLFPHRNHVVQMRSSAAEPYLPTGIGLLLVDGCHDYDDCLGDLNGYCRKIVRGGFLAVDDVWYDSVRSATDDFCHTHPGYVKEVALEKLEIYRKTD